MHFSTNTYAFRVCLVPMLCSPDAVFLAIWERHNWIGVTEESLFCSELIMIIVILWAYMWKLNHCSVISSGESRTLVAPEILFSEVACPIRAGISGAVFVTSRNDDLYRLLCNCYRLRCVQKTPAGSDPHHIRARAVSISFNVSSRPIMRRSTCSFFPPRPCFVAAQ